MPRKPAATTDGKDAVDEFLKAYGRGHPADLQAIADFKGWQELARRQQEAWAATLVMRLPQEVVAAIANGEVDFSAAAQMKLRDAGGLAASC